MNIFILKPDNARARFAVAWKRACEYLQHGQTVKVELAECKATRTILQNDKMWAMLGDIADQVEWHVDGKLQFIEPEDWKDILTAGLKKTQRVASGIDGGFVILGQRTRKMKIGQMCELITFMEWFGTERKVIWSTRANEIRANRQHLVAWRAMNHALDHGHVVAE